MDNNDEIVLLYSGGTDSTLTAVLMAEKFRRVHLITYDRLGLFSIINSKVNVKKLKNKFGEKKFTHRIIKINKLSKYVFYERYLLNFIKYRFFLLSICGLCKLAMHIRTVVFCLDNKIYNVCDGANKGMDIFPAQMKEIIKEITDMYLNFGIKYINPVFDFDGDQDTGFVDRLHFEKIFSDVDKDKSVIEEKKRTTNNELFKMGLMPSGNVKGTELDRRMQSRCFQFILFNIFVRWYYLYNHSYQQYKETTIEFYREKIDFFAELLNDYIEKGKKSRMGKLIEG
ncbi:MAG: hypothetical protein KAS51_03290 [Candidatus Omnitrophica bacterium]|nr:hypothetical protein [Candidatus Omnitrophota bacterium]